jgi:thioredoxin-like negative regulator of GroEL
MSTARRVSQNAHDRLIRYAETLIAHNEYDAAEALLSAVVQREPDCARARELLSAVQPVRLNESEYDGNF